MASSNADTTGVILLAFGGADSMDGVEPFVRNVFKGRGDVGPELIEDAKRRYRLIGGASPLVKITKAQAGALGELLNKKGDRYAVSVGMLNSPPFIKDAVKEMKDRGVSEAAAIVMSAHSTPASTGGYRSAMEEALKETGGVPRVDFMGGWHTHPLYIEAVVETVNEALLCEKFSAKQDTLVIFSAHSLPVHLIANDPYVDRIGETIAEVAKKVDIEWKLAFQSRGRRGEWLGPGVEEVMKEAKDTGRKGVLIVPVGFTSDHIETLYDIDIFFKEAARVLGLGFSRAPSLNTREKFMEMLADVILRRRHERP
ncbi:MAG: ferrochelatase [Deltaproteobacteria bacterium]|nr:ferrochelatase [Deltaproteobacteria bacterium]